jgi:hypothetical protein
MSNSEKKLTLVTGKLHAKLVTLVFVLRCHAGPEFFDFFVFVRVVWTWFDKTACYVGSDLSGAQHTLRTVHYYNVSMPPLVIKLCIEAFSVIGRKHNYIYT